MIIGFVDWAGIAAVVSAIGASSAAVIAAINNRQARQVNAKVDTVLDQQANPDVPSAPPVSLSPTEPADGGPPQPPRG